MANEGIMAAPMPMQQQQQPPQGYVSSLDAYNAAASAMQETNPQAFSEYKTAIGSKLSELNLKPSEIESFVTLLEYMLQYPDQYKEVIRAGIEAGAIEEGDFPPEFDQGFISTMLAALNEQRIQQAQNVAPEAMGPGPQEPMAMKSGGLADAAKVLQAKGRGRDTILAHITPQEAEMLRKAGGLGTTNPYTGLKEYGWLKDAWNAVTAPVKAVVNVVKDVAKSPIGRIALTIGATMLLGPVAAGFGIGTAGTAAIVGGGMAALTGGNMNDILKGAALGYLGGAISPTISGYLPGAAGSVLNQGLTGAAMGTGFGLATGMSAKDALKAGAIGGLTGAGVAYGQQQGYLPGGQPAASEAADSAVDMAPGPVEAAGPVGTATDVIDMDTVSMGELVPVMRTDALAGQPHSVMHGNTEFLVYKDATGQTAFIRADPMNPGRPLEGALPVRDPSIPRTGVSSSSTSPSYATGTGQSPQAISMRPTPSASVEVRDTFGYRMANDPPINLDNYDTYRSMSEDTYFRPASQPQTPAPVVNKDTYTPGALYERASDAITGGYDKYFSPNRSSIQQQNQEAILAGTKARANYIQAAKADGLTPTAAGADAAYQAAYEANAPGFFSKYAPLAAAGLGATYLAGGFDKPPVDDTPVYDPAYTGTDYMRDNPQAFSGSLYNYQSPGAGAYDPYRETRYAGDLGAATRGVVTPTGIMQAEYSPYYGRRVRQQQYYSPFIGTSEPIMAAKGGSIRQYPRKTGPISGPGTGTSDDIPAMLSDGEFVFTAKAVRNAGGGSRRKGAARMYKLMKSLEKGGLVKG